MTTRHTKNHRKTGDRHPTYKGVDLEVFDRAVPEGAAAVARELLAVAARLERKGYSEGDVTLGASTTTILLAYASPTPRRAWLINWLHLLEAGIREEDEYGAQVKRARALLKGPTAPARPAGPTTKGKLQ
jgi:hypothetical protein